MMTACPQQQKAHSPIVSQSYTKLCRYLSLSTHYRWLSHIKQKGNPAGEISWEFAAEKMLLFPH